MTIKAPHASEMVYEYLKNSASVEMNVNGAPTKFSWTCPAGKAVELVRMNYVLVDGAIRYGQFGGLGAALTNGILVEIEDASGNTVLDITGGTPIKANEDFGALSGVDNIAIPAAGDDSFPVRHTLAKASIGGRGIGINAGESVVVTIRDNLTELTKFRCMLQGRYLS